MAEKKTKIKCPPTAGSGTNTFSDHLTGGQITNGSSQLSNTNFLWDEETPEKDERHFITEDFSKPISLDDLDPKKVQAVQQKRNNDLFVRFRKDLSDASYIALYGSLKERIRVAVNNIIRTFPAAITASNSLLTNDAGVTATNISYDSTLDRTTFNVPQYALKNDFEIQYLNRDVPYSSDASQLRQLTKTYTQYAVQVSGQTYSVLNYTAPSVSGDLRFTVQGRPFATSTYGGSFYIRPNDQIVEDYFTQLDTMEQALLNRNTYPLYTISFQVPRTADNGETFFRPESATWPSDGYNLDVSSNAFTAYLTKLNEIADVLDDYRSNLITRFLVTDSLMEFDTPEQKINKILKIYGHYFDNLKMFIDNIAYMRNVSYDKANNVPDVLLKNLCDTLGLESITTYRENELNKLMYRYKDSDLLGEGKLKSIAEADVELYRRLLVNIAYLFKSKGTRKAIEFLLKMLGTPESLIEFNEYVYKADAPLDVASLQSRMNDIINGKVIEYEVLYAEDGYRVREIGAVTGVVREDFPIDDEGYPTKPRSTDNVFFQKGAGWFERTTEHKSEEILDTERSVLTGHTKVIKTRLNNFTYGQQYLDVYRSFPYMNVGFTLQPFSDNTKVTAEEDRLVLNVKNIDLNLSYVKGVEYDVWRQSNLNNSVYGVMPSASGMTFDQYRNSVLDYALTDINDLKYVSRYTALENIFNSYYSGVSTPYSFSKVEQYVNKISPQWIRIVEQFIPATTLWFGGNLISNSVFHRPKFKWVKPCEAETIEEPLYPTSFSTSIQTATAKIVYDHFRGLCLYSGVTVNPMLELDTVDYIGTGTTITPLGYTKPDACGKFSSYGTAVPLNCNYDQYLNLNETSIRAAWVPDLEKLFAFINTGLSQVACGYSGVTYSAHTLNYTQYEWSNSGTTYSGETLCIDNNSLTTKKLFDYVIDGDTVRFTTVKNGYNDCVKEINLGYTLDQKYTCYPCTLYAELKPATSGSTVDCTVTQNVILKVYEGASPYTFYVDGVQTVLTSTGNCDEFLLSVTPNATKEILIGDSANCQTKIIFKGLENICIGQNLYVCQPLQEIDSVYNFGFDAEAYVIKLTSSISAVTSLNVLTEGVDYTKVQIKTLVTGDKVLGSVGGSYKVVIVDALSKLYNNKTIKVNATYNFYPNQQVFTTSGWTFAKDLDTTYRMQNHSGGTVTVTSVVADMCTAHLLVNVTTDETDGDKVAIYVGTTSVLILTATAKGNLYG